MKERYLHYIWKHRMILSQYMTLCDGRNIKIIHPGTHNQYESGPDFSNAIIEIDGIKWHGSIELHVNAKDWYVHRHHKDPSYNNVILHVVYNDDEKVLQNGWEIPQLELKKTIDLDHYRFYSSMLKPNKTILCGNQLRSVPQSLIDKLLNEKIEQRLQRKNETLKISLTSCSKNKVSFYLLAKAIGSKVNTLAFEELATRLRQTTIDKQPFSERLLLMNLVSGLYIPQNAEEILLLNNSENSFAQGEFVVMSSAAWKTKGMRCKNWFDLRMKQFALLIGIIPLIDQIIAMPVSKMNEKFIEYLAQEIVKTKIELKFSKEFINHLMINWIVPYISWLANNNKDTADYFKVDLTNKALELLSILKPDSNAVVQQWKQYGLNVKNALTSQALLENYNEFCKNKKCMSCSIGCYLLN